MSYNIFYEQYASLLESDNYDVVNSNLTTNDVPTIIDSFKGIEGIHEVKCSPNDKYILLTEFCLEGHIHPPSNENINVFEQYDLWDSYEESGPIITNLRVYEIQKENMIKLIPKGFTPGHVEFSSKNNNIFYLSCHSMLKAYGKVILYGQALLEKYTIKDDWVKSSQAYTSSDFLRITSHEVFTYNNRGFIAVTVYPNYLYIFDEDNFKIIKKIKLFDIENIDSAKMHFCTLNKLTPLWLNISDNSKYIILVSDFCFYIYDLSNNQLKRYDGYCKDENLAVTAHITNINR